MAEALKNEFDGEIEFIESGGGVFEVCFDDELIFSKKQQGRFPEHEEILEPLRARK